MERLEQILGLVLDDAFELERRWGRGRPGTSCIYQRLDWLDRELRNRRGAFASCEDEDFCDAIRQALNKASFIEDDWRPLAVRCTKKLTARLEQLDTELRLVRLQTASPATH